MKIGILTFHRAINYGAFLQCYSTKRFLESKGHSVNFVDYWPIAHANTYKPFTFSLFKVYRHNLLYAFKRFFLSLLCLPRAYKRYNKMRLLVMTHFNLPKQPQFIIKEQLSNVRYDAIIYGSDQIWWKSVIPDYEGFDDVYWGDFTKSDIKIAFAASMGVLNVNNDDTRYIRKHLQNFSSISVRELELMHLLRAKTDRRIDIVLDPVFLADDKIWEACISKKTSVSGQYILYYNLMKSEESDRFVEKLSKQLSFQVIEITGRVEPFKMGNRYVQTADAFDFLSYIYNSSYVVSTSFHGTAFSIIFNKQFYALGMGENSGRVKSLLDQLGLSKRLVSNIDSIETEPIDYNIVNGILCELRKQSRLFIEKSLNGTS